MISGLGGIGAAAGPLIGGVITSGISWRAAFVFQALVVGDDHPAQPSRRRSGSRRTRRARSTRSGALLSAVGHVLRRVRDPPGRLNNDAAVRLFLAVGVAFLAGFFLFIRSRERAGKEPLLSTELFRNRTSNLGLITQNLQWLLLMGVSFVVSVFLQTERHYSAIKTGVIFTAATLGILASSLAAERTGQAASPEDADRCRVPRHRGRDRAPARLWSSAASSSAWAFAPGLLLIGLGVGVMLTPSVNLVQSAFPEEKQGEISGLSRSVSNLGSSFGTAIAGTILVSDLVSGNGTYVAAMIVLAVVGVAGLAIATLLPADRWTRPRACRQPRGGRRGGVGERGST